MPYKTRKDFDRKVNTSEKTVKLIHLVSDIVISLMLFACGISFSVSCYSVYTSAESQMFTYKSIGAAFDKIAAVVYITLALVLIGAVLSFIFPRGESRLKAPKRVKTVCKGLARRVDAEAAPEDLKNEIKAERRCRSILKKVNAAVITLSAILPLIYLLNPANFPAQNGEYNSEILHGMLLYLLMLLPLAAYETAYFIITRRSYAKEAELLKTALKLGAKADGCNADDACPIEKARRFFDRNEGAITLGVRIALFACAAVFIVVGIVNGGMADVLKKAVAICAECIGLG